MDIKYWVALLQFPGLSSKHFFKLLESFGTGREIWQASRNTLLATKILSRDKVDNLITWRKSKNPDIIFEELHKKRIKVVSILDENYPFLLKKIYDPPALLYYKGQLLNYTLPIAVVGSRKASPYGKKIAEQLAKKLASCNFTVVSGMARGIDSYSHKGALAAGKKTVAVLGNGVDVIYPPENKGLYESIIENGCVMSEFPPGSSPQNWHFPARNRIISGISRAVIVVEAAQKSGALITVDYALEQGRDVFSVPGPITSKYSLGTNNLIKQGAKPVTCVEDILEEFDVKPLFENFEVKKSTVIKLTESEKQVLKEIEQGPCEIDTISQRTGLKLSEINATCVILEMKGLIRKIPGKKYIKVDL